MKPFNLERALAGDKVITRDGREVVQLFYADKANENIQLVVIFSDGELELYYKNGNYHQTAESEFDLFMATTTVKVEYWLNIYDDGSSFLYPNKDDAEKAFGGGLIACVHLTGEFEA